ncbi:MAG: transposase family protein [Nocardioidaceae bacterium]
MKRPHLARLVAELRGPWDARVEGQRHQRRGHRRLRAAGAGRKHELEFADRVLVTLAVLRLQLPHATLALMFDVDRSTVTRAVHQIRPLLAGRGFATATGRRLRTLDDVFAHAAAEGIALRVDGSEIQVRRPRGSRPGRRAFVSGKKKQNTIKFTEITGPEGRTLWAGCFRPGRMHDQTAIKSEGIDGLLRDYPDVDLQMDDGYRGLARDYPDQVTCPPKKPAKNATEAQIKAQREARHAQSSSRICVEHGIGELKSWRTLQRWIGRRDYLPETIAAIAGLVSDRTLATG